MEWGADICWGKLTGAAGSSRPRAKQTLSAPQLLSWHPLSSWIFLPALGVKSSAAVKSKCAKWSQQEIHILPKARAKWGGGAASSGSGCSVGTGGCVRQIWGQTGPRAASKVLIHNKQIKQNGSPWFKGRPWNRAFDSIIFWMHPKYWREGSPWTRIPCSSAELLWGSRYFRK